MKDVKCKDCGKVELVCNVMPEPWLCKKCLEAHRKNAAKDQEIENEISQEEVD